ncbi:hypothetical protein GNF98_13000 [Clostridium perfringens]|uniref:hypothetical protein n=1 Tax=Clostridium perfringens TaxID=1502 RepID=UPI002A2A77C2|nr:hypothetical protein [Clostridium perfringens]
MYIKNNQTISCISLGTFLLNILLALASLIVASIIMFLGRDINFIVAILPLANFIFILFLQPIRNNEYKHISFCLLVFYFIRNVIVPFFYTLSGYYSMYKGINNSDITTAVVLMVYETFVAYAFMCIYSVINHTKRNIDIQYKNINTYDHLLKFSIIFLFIFCALNYIRSDYIRECYTTIFSNNIASERYRQVNEMISYGTIDRILFTITLMFVPILQCIVPVMVIKFVKDKCGERLLSVLVGYVFIAINFFFISDSNMDTIVLTIIITIVMSKIFPKYSKKILVITSIIAALGIVIIATLKIARAGETMSALSNGDRLDNITVMLSAYCPSIPNIAAGINLPSEGRIETLFFDFYFAIPFKNTLFGLVGNNLTDIYNISNNVSSQLLPNIVQTQYYLGYILSPLMSCVYIYIGFNACSKYNRENNTYKLIFYLYLMIYSVMDCVTANASIFLRGFLQVYLIIYILGKLTSIKVKQKI